MTPEFTMDLRIEVFHPSRINSYLKDESRIAVAALPIVQGFPHPLLTGKCEIVPTVQRDAAIQRVVMATIALVHEQNEARKPKLE